MGQVEFFHANLVNFGYKISVESVQKMVKKFEADPNAKPVGGPEQFVKAWMTENPDDS